LALSIGKLIKLANTPDLGIKEIFELARGFGLEMELDLDVERARLREIFTALATAATRPEMDCHLVTCKMPDGLEGTALLIVSRKGDCDARNVMVESGGQVLAAPGRASLNADRVNLRRPPTSLGKS
jgi:hypothetical protein